ncbi:MAG: type IV pilus modification protein PilV [Gammaproteobacteria bacterium]|nr:type IV pilus modification protein PilV [Gammaproteobacteria bacterium]
MRPTSHTQPTGHSLQRGFTLLEVLIAVVVLSIGLLGVAGLQAFGLRNNQDAYMRSQATILATDIAERMRANMTGVEAGTYDQGVAVENTNCNDATTGCTANELAQHDLYQWRTALFAALPTPNPAEAGLGEGVVCIDSDPTPDADGVDGTGVGDNGCDGTGGVYAVKIWWDTNRDGGMDGYFWTSFQP